MFGKKVVCIDGSLGKGNLGDEALLGSFVSEHREDFTDFYAICSGSFGRPRSEVGRLDSPLLFSGWRSFRGRSEKASAKRDWLNEVGASAVHACLGGLFVGDIFVDLRAQMFELTRSIGWRRCYYFGDFYPCCRRTRRLKELFRLLNDVDAWVGVRSQEAADLMFDRGFRGNINVGVDPVLYAQCSNAESLLKRRDEAQEFAALIPSYKAVDDQAVKRWWCNAVHQVEKVGLQIRWCIFDEMFDVAAASEISMACGKSEEQFQGSLCFGEHALRTVERAAICFSERYHGSIFPMAAGVPTVTHGWNEKIRRLFQLLELDAWCVQDQRDEVKSKVRLNELIKQALSNQWHPNVRLLKTELASHRQALACFRTWQCGR